MPWGGETANCIRRSKASVGGLFYPSLTAHSLHGAGSILRPGDIALVTLGNPVLSHAEHLSSVGLTVGFIIQISREKKEQGVNFHIDLPSRF
jgi:hypothetical protein